MRANALSFSQCSGVPEVDGPVVSETYDAAIVELWAWSEAEAKPLATSEKTEN